MKPVVRAALALLITLSVLTALTACTPASESPRSEVGFGATRDIGTPSNWQGSGVTSPQM